MDAFSLTFDALPEGGGSSVLDAPPRLRLAEPEHGWIDLVVGEEGGGFAPVTLSQVYPPLADLWAWSLAVAWGLMPVTVRLDEASSLVYLVAEVLPDGGRASVWRVRMAESDAWLDHPDPDHTPEEVWRRWQDEQRQKGGHDDA